MRYRYDIHKGLTKIKTNTKLSVSALTVGAAGLVMAIAIPLGAHASTSTIYNNIPSPQPPNVPSVGFEATSTSEFGGQVGLAGTNRQNPTITVLMSSWACQSGSWTSGCTTTAGSTFTHPVTLNIYNVGPANSVGSLIATNTATFTMPYRPSSGGCTGDATAWLDSTTNTCNHGLAFPISFSFTGVTLPNNVILGVAYNTSNYGTEPIGITGPYDSLNVGTSAAPTVGTALPTLDDAYLNSSWGGAYCDSGLGTGTFRLDAGCWAGFLPAFKVDASSVARPAAHATGGVTLSGPRQQLSFEAHDNGGTTGIGNVNYTNFDANLHYNADLTCANVSGNTAYFAYQIPNNAPVAAGVWVVWKVVDGGSPGKGHDTAGFVTAPDGSTATSLCQSGNFTPTNYTITAGNLVVH